MLGLLSGILLLQALIHVGCCGSSGCDINHIPNKQKSATIPLEDTTFKEFK